MNIKPNHEQRLELLEKRVDQLESMIDIHDAARHLADARLTGTETELKSHGATIGKLLELAGVQSQNITELIGLQKDVVQRLDQLGERLDQTNQRLDETNQRLNGLIDAIAGDHPNGNEGVK